MDGLDRMEIFKFQSFRTDNFDSLETTRKESLITLDRMEIERETILRRQIYLVFKYWHDLFILATNQFL